MSPVSQGHILLGPFPCWGSRMIPAAPLEPQSPRVQQPALGLIPAALTPTPAGTTLDVVEVESYDPYTDTWTPVSPALKYVSNFSAAGCGGRLYLVGSSACKYNALALQCYNPVAGAGPGTVSPTVAGGVSQGQGPGGQDPTPGSGRVGPGMGGAEAAAALLRRATASSAGDGQWGQAGDSGTGSQGGHWHRAPALSLPGGLGAAG